MPDSITIERLENNLNFFQKMYDAIRLVDPVKKVIIEYQRCERKEAKDICYAYWKNGRICDNCISVRAYLGDKCFMKLEQSDAAIMLVTAIPIENTDEPTVLELLRNASDTMLLGHGEYTEGRVMHPSWAELNDVVIKDDLTGLYNRRFINERLPADILRSTLKGEPLSVIFADVDNMKQINDAYGHSAGDLVLIETAGILKECVRSKDDWVARFGGDEFLICLNSTDEASAKNVMERIYTKFAGMKATFHDADITASISLGVHTMRDDLHTANEIIELADQKMYEIKQQKRKDHK